MTPAESGDADRDRTVTRRSTLKSGGVAILGGVGLKSRLNALTGDTVRIPKLVSGDEVVATLAVPRDWYQHRNHAVDVLDGVRDRLESITGVVGTELGRSERTFGDHDGLKIYALVNGAYGQGATLPSDVRGIEVETEPAPDAHFACSGPNASDNCTNKEDDEYIHGGEWVGWENGGFGSATIKVNYDGSERLLHCGHVFWEDCDDATSNDLTGRTAAARGTDLGKTVKVDVRGDWSVIDRSLGGSYYYGIDDDDEYPTVVGYVTKATLDHWASTSSDPCVRNMGVTTGKTYGKTWRTNTDYTKADCTDMRNEGIRTKCDFGNGDSGGPTWHRHDGDAYMVSCTGYFYNADGYACDRLKGLQSAGIGAYWLTNNEPIDFASDKTV